MNRDEAVAILKRGLGFLTSTLHDDNIVATLQQAQALREGGRSLPWFLLQEDEEFPLVVGQRAYDLPAGFLKEDVDFNEVSLVTPAGKVKTVEPLPYDDAIRLYDLELQAAPEVYAVRGDSFNVFPLPDDVHTIRWSYYKGAKVLDNGDDENEWLEHAPYVLISDAGLKMAKDLRDLSAVEIYRDDKAQWDDWFTRRMTEQRESNIRYVVGKYA